MGRAVWSGVFLRKIKRWFWGTRRSGAVRFMTSVTFVVGLALAALHLHTGSAVRVYVETDVALVTTGETFPVEVFVDTTTPVYTVDVGVLYDPLVLELVRVDYMDSVLSPTKFQSSDPSGTAQILGSTFGGGFLGTQRVATLYFTPRKKGEVTFSIEHAFLFGKDGEVPLNIEG